MVSKYTETQVKKKKHHECSLELLQAFKPHSSAVTAMAIDSKGEILATGVSFLSVLFLREKNQICILGHRIKRNGYTFRGGYVSFIKILLSPF